MSGDDYPGAESMDSVLRAMQTNLPGVIRAITAEQPGVARTQAEVDAAVSPIYADTQVKLYDTAGRELNRIGSEIETANQMEASRREAAVADTYGTQLVQSADRLGRILDPEFYAGREAVGTGINKLLSSMDPTQLTGSERAEIERSIAKSGDVNPGSAAETAANATLFGKAQQEKASAYGDAVLKAANALPATRTGASAFEIGTRRALTSNTGNQQFVGVQTGTGQNAWQTGNNVMAQAGALEQIKAQKSTSLLDDIMKGTQAFSNVVGSFSFA